MSVPLKCTLRYFYCVFPPLLFLYNLYMLVALIMHVFYRDKINVAMNVITNSTNFIIGENVIEASFLRNLISLCGIVMSVLTRKCAS